MLGDKPRGNCSAKIARNPLISHDSDERIQGNPRQSNTLKWGNSQRNGERQENPNLPRLLPAPVVALAPVTDRAALVLEPPPLAPCVGQRRLVASVEHENHEIERLVGLSQFAPLRSGRCS